MNLLIVTADAASSRADGQALRSRLHAAGLSVLGSVSCHMLVHEVARLAPQVVVLPAAALDAPLQSGLALLAASAARPVVAVGGALRDDPTPLLDARVMAWLPGLGDRGKAHAA